MKATLAKFRHIIATLTLGLGMAGLTTVLTVAPAAAANTYLWNDVRGSVQVYYLPNQGASNSFDVPNGERFVMNCWLDNAGHRWFYGQTWNHGWGYVWAAWVYEQTPVPPC